MLTRKAVGAIIEYQGKYLLLHKSGNSNREVSLPRGGVWDFLKGGVEPNESYKEALRRELLEEINITSYKIKKELKECLYFDFPQENSSASFPYQNQKTVFFVINLLEDLSNLKADGTEIDKYKIVPVDQVENLLTFDETKEYFRRNILQDLKQDDEEVLVSVIMPVYNRKDTLMKAAKSVLNQTWANIELWIVDDGSTDETPQVIEQLKAGDQRVKSMRNSHAKGVSGARNTALERIQGNYVAFLDSDDEWDTEYLLSSYRAVKNTGVDIAFSFWTENHCDGTSFKIFSADFARAKLNRGLENLKPRRQGIYYIFDNRRFYDYVLTENFYCFHINTTFFNAEIIKTEKIYFDETLRAGEDLDFIGKIIKNHKACLFEEFHYFHNQGTDNLYNFKERDINNLEMVLRDSAAIEKFTNSDKYKIDMLKKRINYVKNDSEFSTPKKCISNCREKIGRKYLMLGLINQKANHKAALIYIWKSLFYEFRMIRLKVFLDILNPFKKSPTTVDNSEIYFY